MKLIDDHKIYESYLLTELFNSYYNLDEIKGVFSDNTEQTFPNFDKLFTFHLKYKNDNPIYYIKCYFNDKDNNIIEIIIYPSINNSTIFEENIVETFVVLFRPKINPDKMKLNSYDASKITSTVMNCILIFLNAYKNIITNVTNDWDTRTKNGIIRFDPYPNISMNPISKQNRSKKEENRGFSQRENLYKSAFIKIIKPIYPELYIVEKNTYFIIKS